MSRRPRFEIVRTDGDQPWHTRLRAANGRIVWWTENYARRAGADNAIGLLADADTGFIEVRDVDERVSA